MPPSNPPLGPSDPEEGRGALVEFLATASRPLRRGVRELGHALERTLHPWRHRRALRVLAASPVRSVIFVCLGNICRSPFAEYRLRALLRERDGAGARHPSRDAEEHPEGPVALSVESVGLILPGRPSPEVAQSVAGEFGLDLTPHRSRLLTDEVAANSDLLLVMTTRQLRDVGRRYPRARTLHLGDLDPGPVPRRDIDDPYGNPPETFRRVYRRIDRILPVLRDRMGGSRGDED
jgi:protein-tyrosine phosphatase